MALTFEPMMIFWCPSGLSISKYCIKNLFYGWKLHLYPFGLGGDVKEWYEHSIDLALFVQKTKIGVDGFKLHNMVADKKNPTS